LILRGWASAQQGEFEKGIAEIQAGLEKERATDALLFELYTSGLLADACIKNERYKHALDFLNQAQSRLSARSSRCSAARRSRGRSLPAVGFANSASPEGHAPMATAFDQALKQTGYVEAQNLTVGY
jgi:predicted ATPase